MSQDAQLAYKETPAHVGGSPTDVNSWQKLIDVAEESKDLSKVSRAYEALLEAFPKTVRSLTPWYIPLSYLNFG